MRALGFESAFFVVLALMAAAVHPPEVYTPTFVCVGVVFVLVLVAAVALLDRVA